MSSSKARKLLFASFGDDKVITKFRSRREDGRELYEVIDQTTGDTLAFQFTYPDGRIETCIVKHDYSKDYEG
jgi:hypothetical protein